MTNYNAVSVNQNDNRDTVKAKQIWNNGQYNRNLYGSDDSIKPTPNTGLISLKKEDVEGTSKKLFRLRHCFDYYKDLPLISELSDVRDMSGNTVKDYAQWIKDNKVDYWMISKDMFWNIKSKEGVFNKISTVDGNNNGIQRWESYWTYHSSLDGRNHGNNDGEGSYWVHPIFSGNYTYSADKGSWGDYGINGHSQVYNGGSYGSITKNFNDPVYSPLCLKITNGDKSSFSGLLYDITPVISTSFSLNTSWNYKHYSDVSYSKLPISILSCIESYNNVTSKTVTYWRDKRPDESYEEHNKNGKIEVTLKEGSYSYKYGMESSYQEPKKTDCKYPKNQNEGAFYGCYLYVTYENVEPYVISNGQLKSNANYFYMGGNFKVSSWHAETNDWGVTTGHYHNDRTVTILPTLMHEFCEPTICPYDTKYIDNIDIGLILVKYNMIKPGLQNVLDSKTIPVKFTAYKCEAYKKK